LQAALEVHQYGGARLFLQIAPPDDGGQSATMRLVKRTCVGAQRFTDHNGNDRATGLQPVE
jgi:hypothetical protein